MGRLAQDAAFAPQDIRPARGIWRAPSRVPAGNGTQRLLRCYVIVITFMNISL